MQLPPASRLQCDRQTGLQGEDVVTDKAESKGPLSPSLSKQSREIDLVLKLDLPQKPLATQRGGRSTDCWAPLPEFWMQCVWAEKSIQ